MIHCMLKPFKWFLFFTKKLIKKRPHPLIYTISEDLLLILDSPVPILCGLNKSYQYAIENELETRYKNILFVNLDDRKLININ